MRDLSVRTPGTPLARIERVEEWGEEREETKRRGKEFRNSQARSSLGIIIWYGGMEVSRKCLKTFYKLISR